MKGLCSLKSKDLAASAHFTQRESVTSLITAGVTTVETLFSIRNDSLDSTVKTTLSERRESEEIPRDDELVYLRGSLGDGQHLRIAEVPLDVEFAR